MFQLVARAIRPTLAFRTWREGRVLWDAVVAATPGVEALVLMPDHLHLMHPEDVRLALGAALSGYARWRNHQRGERGPVFEPVPPASPLADHEKRLRALRYFALNPCRAKLVADPLEWPFSSYRDEVGLALQPIRRANNDPARLHAYVSSDPSVRVDGTELPRGNGLVARPDEVAHAVSALGRAPLDTLGVRGRLRTVYLRSARVLCHATLEEIATWAQCSEATVSRAHARVDDDVRRVARVVGDPRFSGLLEGDLRRLPGWRRYRDHL